MTPPREGTPKRAEEIVTMTRDMSFIDSARLFADRKEVHIRHEGEFYRLLVTRNGKLILNK
jgi:hemin uptake protein HemP